MVPSFVPVPWASVHLRGNVWLQGSYVREEDGGAMVNLVIGLLRTVAADDI